jgi:hypothetical protein
MFNSINTIRPRKPRTTDALPKVAVMVAFDREFKAVEAVIVLDREQATEDYFTFNDGDYKYSAMWWVILDGEETLPALYAWAGKAPGMSKDQVEQAFQGTEGPFDGSRVIETHHP